MGNQASSVMSKCPMGVCPMGLCLDDTLVELQEENAMLLEKIVSLEAERNSLQQVVGSEVEKRKSKEKVHEEKLLETEELRVIVDGDSHTIAALRGKLTEERRAVQRERVAREKWQAKAEKLEANQRDSMKVLEKEKRSRELELLMLKQRNRELTDRLHELETYHSLNAFSKPDAVGTVGSPCEADDIKRSMALSASLLATALPRKLPSQAASSVTTATDVSPRPY